MAKIIGNIATTPMAIPDWNQTDPAKADYIKNKPELANIATSGSYEDLKDAPDFILASDKGLPNGVAVLDNNGKVPSEQLPFNLDGIIEGAYNSGSNSFTDADGNVVTPDIHKIYSDINSGKTYRWGGSLYVEISSSVVIGTTSASAYRGDYGHIAYTHSQIEGGNPHKVSYDELVNKPLNADVITYILSIFGTNGSRGLKYDVYDDYAICTGMTESYTDTELRIASTIKGVPVRGIGEGAFTNCDTFKSVVIPLGVTSIGDHAFEGCWKLTNASIPSGITDIGYMAFSGCEGLTTVNIPDSVTNIGGGAFSMCVGLTDIVIPDNVTSIEDSTFFGCANLESVIIGQGVKSIGNSAFTDCSKLENIIIPDKTTIIGYEAFSGCKELKSVVVGNNVEYINYEAFKYCNKITDMTLPFIGSSAIESTYLGYIFGAPSYIHNSAYVPESLKSITVTENIGNRAFYNCNNLQTVTIGVEVDSIGESAFSGCYSLTDVYYQGWSLEWQSVVISDGNTSLTNDKIHCMGLGYVLNSDGASYLVTLGDCKDTDIIIPSVYRGYPVTRIADSAFSGYTQLISIEVPDSVTSIESLAFSGCSNLTSIIIPDSVTNIGHSVFADCASLTDISLPNSVTSFGDCVFTGCSNLTEAIVPYGAGSIGYMMFSGCTNLTSVTIPDSVTNIAFWAFGSCSSLTSIIIPSSVTSIESFAFSSCSKLTSIYYQGTEDEWNGIDFGDMWNSDVTATIYYGG